MSKCERCGFEVQKASRHKQKYCGRCHDLEIILSRTRVRGRPICPSGWFLVYLTGGWCCQPEWLALQNRAKGYYVYGMDENA